MTRLIFLLVYPFSFEEWVHRLSDLYGISIGMATGQTHDRITLFCCPLLAVVGFSFTRDAKLTLWLAISFLFSGLMFGPDLDIHSNQTLRWGWLQWLWYPYRYWIPHRSPLSHGPIVGTAIRILYLSSLLIGGGSIAHYLLWLLGQPIGDLAKITATIWQSILHQPSQFLAALIGLELGAMSHYLADIGSSTINQWRRPSAPLLKSLRKKRKSKRSR